MIAAGVQPPDFNVESGFVGDVEDGYRLRSEEDEANSYPSESVYVWMQDVPEYDVHEPADADVDA